MFIAYVVIVICLHTVASKYDEDFIINSLTEKQQNLLNNWTPEMGEEAWMHSNQLEGDIVMAPSVFTRAGLRNEKFRWENKTLVYEFDRGVSTSERRMIVSAFGVIANYSCVQFKERNNEIDYVYITNYPQGCYSVAGRVGGKQPLNLQSHACMFIGVIIHETYHALGFYHEHSAPDRDDYVTIMWDNIKDGFDVNFAKADSKELSNFDVPYNFRSIMHYNSRQFSKNKEQTIIPKDSSAVQYMGQRSTLTFGDLQRLRNMYKC